ncbi:hypothetical protein BURMUCF1_1233 [Burkholderia multivorans ATCC BAA-247]|uniref:Uncharacterized protein n=1 Tax=Burkholderia multivorans CGD2 TaxID=513052 RepID=B9BN58_9BURK|nr:hypothetical protein BURMUCGD1_1970 [Burkholderia multivorans CGD1]EEE08068.1 hypothetical protein BURMUCGD2_2285 [Burkholderia multivorans CGD2]EEE10582.1 hypothetical protein BURMUCGD2M_2372 [Burkholderia multivorans CGD2M]EJO63071.1 hypothetical protein BURMUCF1_1233 [Burkholderia multivorans ATCC BAA-247]
MVVHPLYSHLSCRVGTGVDCRATRQAGAACPAARILRARFDRLV